MNKTLKIVLPVLAGTLAIGTGIGLVAAKSQNTPGVTGGQYRLTTDGTVTDDGTYAYCGGPGMTGGFLQATTDRVATLLGTTVEDLKAQLQSGKTLAEIAQASGVTEAALTETILAPYREHLDTMVKYGYLTEEQKAAALERAQTGVAALITSQFNARTNGTWGGWGPGGMGSMMGPGGFGGMMGRGGGMMGGWQGTTGQRGTTTPGTGFRGMMGGLW